MPGYQRKPLNSWQLAPLLALSIALGGLSASALGQELNLAPDCSQASSEPGAFWPPNNRLKPVQILGVTDPDNDAVTLETQCILQDEPPEMWRWFLGRYDGAGLTSDSPEVRARRRPFFFSWEDWEWVESDGRHYDIVFKATDAHGAMCSGTVSVGIPLKPKEAATDNGYRFESLPGGENCEALPINNPPIIYSAPVSDARVNTPYEYTVMGHDPDADALQYSLVAYPEGMTIDAGSGLVQWTPSVQQEGVQVVSLKTADPGSMEAVQNFEVVVEAAVDELTAAIVANPTTGTSPLTVRFSPDVQNNNIVINNYAWDFDGNGTVDRSDAFGAPQVYTYTGAPGDSFVATLTATPVSGEALVASQTIRIENRAPAVQVSTSASNGHAPLSVGFSVSAQDPQGIGEVSIDFDGDGSFDETINPDVNSGAWNFQTTYQSEGSYLAVVRVLDGFGAETRVTNNAVTVDVNNPLDPIIELTASPLSGNAPLTTSFTATASLFDSSSIAQWRWDLDGDGDYETPGGSNETDTVSFTYSGVDNYYPRVEVITDSDRRAVASIGIQTQSSAAPTLSIPNSSDTINSDASEIATINVNLPYSTQLALWMEDARGLRVASIQAGQDTAAGSHVFQWEGRDDDGTKLAEGDYYAVLGYTTYGLQKEVDLRATTGGVLSYYRRTTANPRTFDRLKQPLRIDYAVDDPAEVSFFWQISFGARLMTLMEHERLGRGQYSLYWNGEYPSGQKIPDNIDRLMPGIVRYSLPSNVIFVKENPRIEQFTLQSTVIADPRREPIGINLTLSKASTVEVVISDMEKGVDVATRVYQDLSSGEHSLNWNGKNNDDQYLAPGDYRIGVRSMDSRGNRSLYWFRSQRIQY